ncbi:MAG: type I DNA topoisomerase [Varibaculum sp.]|nr:type I DNA topoisomerase [Varibaculum sp.]
MAKKLVIVESPAKAKTIGNYLGPDYQVVASIGHVRDLPQPSELPTDMKKGPYGKFAVNVEGDFEPYYLVNKDKKKIVTELKRDLKEADELYLATDEDREGEAIAWHLLQILKPKIPVKRMVFHEITKDAIQEALGNTREINTHLVDAQETRRILDRLYGYEVSPLLWRKVRPGLSAGRVQSVATRMVVQRERERLAFIPATYHDLKATFAPIGADENSFTAALNSIDGVRIAIGKDFNDNGKLKKQELRVLSAEDITQLSAALATNPDTEVAAVESKPYRRRPAAPFTTSTMQQEAGRKLRMSARDTMRTAQYLYENGYITYMRTDSTALSKQAITAARRQASELYGAASIPEKPRYYTNQTKGAQEAHEAIRPAGDTIRTPRQVENELNNQQLALYDLIWKRTIASQMNDATGQTSSVRLTVHTAADAGNELNFSASGTVITDQGFLAAYEEGRDRARYSEAPSSETRLPKLTAGEALDCLGANGEETEHATTPPPRYTEASLIKALEERGIGRPSTYAATISTIIDRGYVIRRRQALIPSWLAFSVTRLLEENLGKLVDYDFTAGMETDLDQIAAGTENRVEWLRNFYWGTDNATGDGKQSGLKNKVDSLGDIDAKAVNSVDLGNGVTLRVGRYGPYLERGDGTHASVPEDLAPDELTGKVVEELFRKAADNGRELGINPATGRMVIVKDGRYGPYVTEVLSEAETTEKVKAPTASLFKTMDISTVNLEQALQLLSLPRVVGTDPGTGENITAQNGRYGPYLKRGTDSRSLTSEDQLFTVTLEEALAIYAQPKTRGRAAAKPPLKELGTDPASGKPVVIKDGRFGPYITDGTTNVTVPRSSSIEEMDAETAWQLLADKRAKGPSKRGGKTRAKSKKKTATKKSGSK